eukprot:jgi/Chlat1/4709/Chrsp30S04760
MASLRNAVKRRTHKERSQPAARNKYGLLEKHKDYVLRARDFHRKDEHLRKLREKAAARNPDEFYFAMERGRTEGGVHVGRRDESNKYTHEELLLMKTQDLKYVSTHRQAEAMKVEKMQAALHYIGLEPANKHTIFLDSREEEADFDAAEYFQTPREFLSRAHNRPREADLANTPAASIVETEELLPSREDVLPEKFALRAERKRLSAYKELQQRKERLANLTKVAGHMAQRKELMGKGRKRKIAGDPEEGVPATYKWKRERNK